MALTAKKIARLVNKQQVGRHPDGTVRGLYLQIASAGAASWILRYERDDHERMLGLGGLDIVSLKLARERAKAARLQLLDGVDPIEAKKAKRAAAALEASRSKTFAQCASEHFRSMESGWRSATHARGYIRSLERHAFPVIGALAVSAIDTAAVMRVIKPLWGKIPVTASRLRQRIESALDYAGVMGYRAADTPNPARWSGHLEHLLPAGKNGTEVKHFSALDYKLLPGFMVDLRQREGVPERALELAILCAARSGEIFGARWREFDLDAADGAVWKIPGTRMKSGVEHRVPLAPAAVALIRALRPDAPDPDAFVFARHGGRRLVRDSLERALARVRDDVTVHGFRSTFRDWASERTAFPFETLEKALAHTVGSKSSRAYARSDLFNERRKLMEAWATYCYSPPAAGEVVPLRARS
jgi:integrase